VGTVTANPAQNSFEILPDGGVPAILKVRTETISQRVSPGEGDLKDAQPAQVAEIAATGHCTEFRASSFRRRAMRSLYG
jgi:hypothetical protein